MRSERAALKWTGADLSGKKDEIAVGVLHGDFAPSAGAVAIVAPDFSMWHVKRPACGVKAGSYGGDIGHNDLKQHAAAKGGIPNGRFPRPSAYAQNDLRAVHVGQIGEPFGGPGIGCAKAAQV